MTEFELELLYVAVYLFPSQLTRGPSIQNPSSTQWIGSLYLESCVHVINHCKNAIILSHIMRLNHNIRKRL